MKNYTLALLLCIIGLRVPAQLAFSFKDAPKEISLNVGPSFFLGDLGGNFDTRKGFIADLNLPATRYFAGLTGTIFPAPWLGIRGGLNVGELYGSDALSTSANDGRRERNLDFRTTIFEGYVGLEIYPLDLLLQALDDQPRMHPYFVAGAGMFHFNPKGTYTNPVTGQTTWIALRPLHTEGEGWGPGFPSEYNLWQPNIPAGIGLKYDLSDRVSLSGELLYRFVFTGYIDDVHGSFVQDTNLFYQHLPASVAPIAVAMANKSGLPVSDFSTRGDPTRTNAYFSMVIGLHIRFGESDSWLGRASSQVRCPTRW
jgi:hypothetical protein